MKTDGTLYDVDPFWGRPAEPRNDQVDALAAAVRENVTLPSPYKFMPWATRLGTSGHALNR